MTVAEPRLKIAVFIDFDNIEIGVKSTLNTMFDIGQVLEALKERGEVVSKIAYSDWKRAGDYSRSLSQHAIKMVQRNLTPGGDKNGADINLALDALEMAFTHPHINAYVIVGGDSDFITLVEKLKQYDKKVLVVGGRSFTSNIMQRNCHEFIAYENLIGVANGRRAADRGGRGPRAPQAPVEQAIPLVKRALEVLTDREVSPQLGLLKSTLLQLDSTFSERSFGASSFRDFAEKLEAAGVVALKHAGRNILVELKDGAERADTPVAADGDDERRPTEHERRARRQDLPAEPAGRIHRQNRSAEPDGSTASQNVSAEPDGRTPRENLSAEPGVIGGIADVRRIFARSKPSRFPMYIRNVKQLLRQTEAGFDERRYGFANLVDLLRAAQREGIVRLERDRQGALRVFQGARWTQPFDGLPTEDPALEALEALEPAEPAPAVTAAEEPDVVIEQAPAEMASLEQASSAAPPEKGTRGRSRRAKAGPPAEGGAAGPAPSGKPRSRKTAKTTRASKTADGTGSRRRTPRKAASNKPAE